MRLLARGERARLVLLTGAVMRPLAHDLLGLRCCPLAMVHLLAEFRLVRMPCAQVYVPYGFLVMHALMTG